MPTPSCNPTLEPLIAVKSVGRVPSKSPKLLKVASRERYGSNPAGIGINPYWTPKPIDLIDCEFSIASELPFSVWNRINPRGVIGITGSPTLAIIPRLYSEVKPNPSLEISFL